MKAAPMKNEGSEYFNVIKIPICEDVDKDLLYKSDFFSLLRKWRED